VTKSGALDVGGLASPAAAHRGWPWTAATMASVASRPRPDHRVHAGVDHAHPLGSQPVARRQTAHRPSPGGLRSGIRHGPLATQVTASACVQATTTARNSGRRADWHHPPTGTSAPPAGALRRTQSVASVARDLPRVAAAPPARPRSVGMGLACRAVAAWRGCAGSRVLRRSSRWALAPPSVRVTGCRIRCGGGARAASRRPRRGPWACGPGSGSSPSGTPPHARWSYRSGRRRRPGAQRRLPPGLG
jgi:hypothetical protein